MHSSPKPGVLEWLAAGCSILFVAMLALAAYWDPSIRLLHVFEAVPYLGAPALILRGRKSGYILGMTFGAFWLWMAGFLTSFAKNGFERLATLLQGGTVDRWDLFIAAPAAVGAGGLLLCSFVLYLRSHRAAAHDLLALAGAAAGTAAYFVALFYALAPQYLGMFHPLVGWF